MTGEYSFDELMEFLNYLGNKGLMSASSVATRKAACSKMLSILDGQEASDLRNLDLNDLATRFANLQGKDYKPESLQVYKSRTGSSLSHFLRYKENPANFAVNTKPRANTKVKRGGDATKISELRDEVKEANPAQNGSYGEKTINVPIALRSNCIVQMNGIPIDLTNAESKKIANVILAMASIDE